MEATEKARENRLRKLANRKGYGIKKSRARGSLDNRGGYMVFNLAFNSIEFGEKFDASLDDIENFLK